MSAISFFFYEFLLFCATAADADCYCCFTRQMRETDASVKSRSMKLQLESGTQNIPPGTFCAVTSIKRRKELSGDEPLRLSQVTAQRHSSPVAARRLNPFVWKTSCWVSLCVSDSSWALISKVTSNPRLFPVSLVGCQCCWDYSIIDTSILNKVI